MKALILWSALLLSIAACSSGSGSGQSNTDAGGSGGSAGTDAGSGPFACGTETCGANQYCIHPCCGGAAPACFDKPDGGSCPSGSHDGCNTGSGFDCTGPDCCEPDPCTPPPPYCADAPESNCLPQGKDCYLMCA
jgi:hypothetical protein